MYILFKCPFYTDQDKSYSKEKNKQTSKFKKTEMKPSRSSDHNAVKLEINKIKIFEKIHKYLEIKQHNDIKMGQRKNHKRN